MHNCLFKYNGISRYVSREMSTESRKHFALDLGLFFLFCFAFKSKHSIWLAEGKNIITSKKYFGWEKIIVI